MTAVLAQTATWWLVVTLIGWASVPVARRMLGSLPDQGIAFARPLGLFACTYIFWIGGFLSVVPNTASGAWFVVLAWIVAGIALWRRDTDWRRFLGDRRRVVWGTEILFAGALVLWALYRSAVPNIEPAGGEKYMEMAFINGILKSPSFPPSDPWMSGFSISYYYFGYLMGALLIRLTGLPSAVGFNLIIPTSLALTLVVAAGIGYSLAALTPGTSARLRAAAAGLAAMLTAVIGNLEGMLEVAYRQGWGSPGFWNHLNIRSLTVKAAAAGGGAAQLGCGEPEAGYGLGAPFGAGGWLPDRFIWWWRGSRVIHDECGEIIHEFPFFSFMLGDVHPHVMALPFVIGIAAVALNILAGSGGSLPSGALGRARDALWSPWWIALAAGVGALGFLNAWDLPAFALLVVGAFGFWVIRARPAEFEVTTPDAVLAGLGIGGVLFATVRAVPLVAPNVSQSVGIAAGVAGSLVAAGALKLMYDRRHLVAAASTLHVLRFAAFLVVISVALYLPYYLALASQVQGVGLVDVRSRPGQWLVHLGIPLFFAGSTVLAAASGMSWSRLRRPHLLSVVLATPAAALLGAALIGGDGIAAVLAVIVGASSILVVETWTAAFDEGVHQSSDGDGVHQSSGRDGVGAAATEAGAAVPRTYALMLAAVGFALLLGLEFVFLRDLFGSRMNSVFKFSYQSWILLGLAGAYAPVAVWRAAGTAGRVVWSVMAVPLVAAGLVFTFAAVNTRTDGWRDRPLTLDGLAWWQQAHPADLAAAEWLKANAPPGATLVEARGDSYQDNAHMSLASGVPTVLGWEFHERQWGRTDEEIGPRVADLERLYTTTNPDEIMEILGRYGARYLVVGPAERSAYDVPSDLVRFERVLSKVYDDAGITIFEVPQ